MTALAILSVSFFVLLLLGVPIFLSLIAACIVLLTSDGQMSAQLVMQRVYAGIDSFPLLAIPFFLLAGKLMEAGGITRRLIDFAFHLVGWIRGGLAHVAVLAATMFAGVSGSSVADTAAIGSTIIPRMKERGYDPAYSASVVAASGVIGSTIPPSIPLVLYGVISGVSIGALFMGGIIPGMLMCLGLMAYIYFSTKPSTDSGDNAETGTDTVKRASFLQVFLKALPALFLPGIIVGGIRTGAFSATEAAAVAVAYAFVIGIAYRELTFGALPEILYRTARDTTLVMIIVGSASLVGYVLTIEQIPAAIAAWFSANVSSVLVLLLMINILLLIAGCFLDGGSAIIVFTPVLLPVVKAFGIDPLFFGVLMSINLMIGTITPPVGLSLYVAGGIAGVKIGRMMTAILPFLGVHLTLLIVLMLFPDLVTAIPNYVYGR